jgi:tripartite-type tricarboxylate transporter receptor subunit TctC
VGHRGRFVCTVAIALTALWQAPSAFAQDAVADFYKGKSIRFVIGAITGGGNDGYARLVARHLGKYIPGNPSLLPLNMPGASGRISAAHIFTVAAKDGTAIGSTTPGVITDPLWAGEAARDKFNYEPVKLIHLGSAQIATYNCYVRADAPVKKFEDAFSAELILGAAQEGGSTRDAPILLNNVLGTKFRVISGYPGTREILVAIERNELQGVCGMGWDAMYSQRPDWLDKGFIRVLVQENLSGNAMFDRMGVPKSIDFAKTPEDRATIELAYMQQAFGRPYILPPGTPAERVDALRKAFLAATRDEELLAEAKKMRVEVRPLAGEDMQALVAKMYAMPRAVVERTRDALVAKPR